MTIERTLSDAPKRVASTRRFVLALLNAARCDGVMRVKSVGAGPPMDARWLFRCSSRLRWSFRQMLHLALLSFPTAEFGDQVEHLSVVLLCGPPDLPSSALPPFLWPHVSRPNRVKIGSRPKPVSKLSPPSTSLLPLALSRPPC
ncbi:hypothetical protein L1887_50251 [Cichorium endivia]|nr:hypothetical protein L1887_50251 [Cichorium endivia]